MRHPIILSSVEDFEKKDFEKLLKRGGLEARRYMKLTDSDVARVYDRNIASIPVTVDLYGQYARVVDYSDGGLDAAFIEEINDIVARYLYVERNKIVFKERRKREGREQHEKGEAEVKVVVRENGHEFLTELSLYADTGLFLDQAYTRAMVEREAAGRTVLNLFSYTSSFSVYAAAGNAESVTSVDLSNVYNAWAKDNLARNGFLDEKKYRVITEDVRAFLEKAYENGERYDLVILDPPAFSNSHKAEDFDVQKDYLSMLYLISRILKDGGAVIFSENLNTFIFDKKSLNPYWDIKEITRDVLAQGFSGKHRSCRVWILEKTAIMKLEKKTVRKKRMDELKDESLDRLVLSEEDGKDDVGTKMDFPVRDGEKKFSRGYEKKDNRGRGREGYGRRDFSDRGERRSDYGRDERPSRRDRDMRERDYSYRDCDERSDRRDSYRSFDDRDRRSSFRNGDDRRRSFGDRDDRRPYGRDRSYGRDGGYTSHSYRRDREDGDNETSRFYRRDRDGRRDGHRSFDDRDRSFSDRDDNRRSFGGRDRDFAPNGREGGERRKKSSPKPYGYDSFMSTSNRDKATAFWLSGQEVQKTDDDK